MSFPYHIFYFFLLFTVLSCSEQETNSNQQENLSLQTSISSDSTEDLQFENNFLAASLSKDLSYDFKYDLKNPIQKAKLPSELTEISALSFNSKDNTLLAVNDELGRIYTLESESGKVLKKVKFSGRGDYEGLEIVEDMAYAIKSNGNLVPIDLNSGKAGKLIKTPFSSSNDVEGLAYDSTNQSLILACKGNPALKHHPKIKNSKAIYAFDLKNKELIETPKFIISDDQLKVFFKQHAKKGLSKGKEKKLKKRLISFSPSAIAKHPKSGHYYIMSSVGKTLIVCDEEGSIQAIQFLSTKTFSQPEGITFSPEGTMYISNEGRGLSANILTFEYQ